jgi:hypothetical protein
MMRQAVAYETFAAWATLAMLIGEYYPSENFLSQDYSGNNSLRVFSASSL